MLVAKEYKAFHAMNKQRQGRIEIRQFINMTYTPYYFHLLDINKNGFYGTELVLVFTFMIVEIKGINLRPVFDALKAGHCEYIQDFNENVFLTPEPKEPFIEWIRLLLKLLVIVDNG